MEWNIKECMVGKFDNSAVFWYQVKTYFAPLQHQSDMFFLQASKGRAHRLRDYCLEVWGALFIHLSIGDSDDADCILASLRHLECEQCRPDRCISGALARKQWMGILNAPRILNTPRILSSFRRMF